MKYEVSAERSGEIAARCPVCGVIVPFAYVNVKQYGFLKRRVSVVLDGDATDFVAHLWTHREPVNSDI
jgi:uncharacterized C2H2 Zn-finger protein